MLPLPLKHYDEAGRIKPGGMFWLICLFPCRALLFFVLSFTFIQDQSLILSFVYPDNRDFYTSLIPIIPAALSILLASHREKIWQRGNEVYFYGLLPLLISAYVIDLSLLAVHIYQIRGLFEWTVALAVLVDTLLLAILLRSQHIKLMLRDWQRQ